LIELIPPLKFQTKILHWYDLHGRKDLPWQNAITPYKVWVSEIMLQQTQVVTVIPYFNNFLHAFPDLETLANAPLDSVLNHWSGLGYYARARNLHKAAELMHAMRAFPNTLEMLMQLPGIGRSTAGAILSIAFENPEPILDGNVKRVLTRFMGIKGWPGNSNVSKQLWDISSVYTPVNRVRDYTQAMMDLGATVCTRVNPACHSCPISMVCLANQHNLTTVLPNSKPAKKLRIKKVVFLLWVDSIECAVFLEKRPASGIWGGLWSLPEFRNQQLVIQWLQGRKIRIERTRLLPEQRHTFSHFHLDFTPMLIHSTSAKNFVLDVNQAVWYKTEHNLGLGLPVPIKKILKLVNINEDSNDD
jgi:A/G-specific adenine glycosylase